MKLQRHGTVVSVALTAALALAACGSDGGETDATVGAGAAQAINCATGTLNAQGSSAQKNAMDEWRKNYQQQCSGSTINYEPSGSGAGVQAFISGTADFAGSDTALTSAQQPQANGRCGGNPAVNLPMVVGPIAVAYNLSGVDNLQLAPATLARIFSGDIKQWDDDAIKADNPGASLPSSQIQTVHRSDESGTTGNFTSYLTAAAGSAWTFGSGQAWKAPGGTGSKGSDGVAQSVSSTDSSIGYMELSFAENAGLTMARIRNGAGQFQELTPEAASRTIEGAQITGTGNDVTLSIDYATTTQGAYPIVLVTYEIVCSKGGPADRTALIKGFLDYTASGDGQGLLNGLGYAPLPGNVQSRVQSSVNNIS
ncbi:phosphate ABC transporter substrate-binding protein PstS [Asanoa sp. WMMD1127]|uniref:phosphate ABC transporter substrate-binding protein PstS n=1 Tax=Asanoa sp. WMMD1127 TaxID=3016107 RepID=UPI002417AE6F|nr:phosphate ABC transporter substrate-binding protein PstS [Asanoa sp. WMMD1127]MDG4824687.1 phosphate ABC transporter substrate-binding protein PstS [Asanoa sp. WMMD1127]